MGFLDNISKTISDVGQSTLQKGKGMVDLAKYNSMVSEEEKKIQKLYEEIGSKYFEKYENNPEELFLQDIQDVKESKNKIEQYKKIIENLKGITQCPKCGAEISSDSAFCASCGAKLEIVDNSENVTRCDACGAVVADGCLFCTSCGKPIQR